MSDYKSLYLIDTNYNSERDATEVVFGYMEKDSSVPGRVMSVRAIVNLSGNNHKVEKKALIKARNLLAAASKAKFEKS